MRRFRICRYDPERSAPPRMQAYDFAAHGDERMLLDALIRLKAIHPSLSSRRSCREDGARILSLAVKVARVLSLWAVSSVFKLCMVRNWLVWQAPQPPISHVCHSSLAGENQHNAFRPTTGPTVCRPAARTT